MKNDHGRGLAMLLLSHTAIADAQLTDGVDSYPIAVDWSQGWHFLVYLLLFVAGFAAAGWFERYRKQGARRAQKAVPPAPEQIEAIEDPKALLKLLLHTDRNRFAAQIAKLERALYGGETISLGLIKAEIIQRSRDDAKG